jgi:hypothetical protein
MKLAYLRFCLFSLTVVANIALADPEKPYEFEEKVWQELPTAIPEFPNDQSLIEFFVGPTERNRFYVDGSTLVVGDDGIVRYVVVIKTPSGANNVMFEAMRCATHEFKLVATGRSNGSWGTVGIPRWHPIENKTVNQYRVILNQNYFCPLDAPVFNAADIRASLRRR